MNATAVEGVAPPARAGGQRDARAANFSWEIDRAALAARSERRAWRVAGAACLVSLVAVAAVFVQGPLRRIETVPIVVDKTTGESSLANKLDITTIPAVDALDMHNAEAFVVAREGYNWSFLQKDYDTVKRMATPAVFGSYNKLFDPPDGLDKRLGSQGEQRIKIIGTRLPVTGRTGNRGEAVVTFERELRTPNKPQPEVTRFVASMRFEYQPKLLAKVQDRNANPFGFVVVAYRADEEFTASRAAAK